MENYFTKRRRYRTRMCDARLSLTTTSKQVRQLQAEADKEERSVASLVREAIDSFLPRLRKRRRKRRPGVGPAQSREAAAGEGRFALRARHLLGEPQERTARVWRYGSLRIDLETGLWKDPDAAQKGGNFLELVQRTLQTDQAGALDWMTTRLEEPPE